MDLQMVELVEYQNEKEQLLNLIKEFWFCHSNEIQTDVQALQDIEAWTKVNQKTYFINYKDKKIGFVHLGSRGGHIDWLEHIFVKAEYQNNGIGTRVIQLVEKIVKQYSTSLYIEAASRNERAIRLYHHLGHNCLNTISLRKDFNQDDFKCIRNEQIYDLDFEIRKINRNR